MKVISWMRNFKFYGFFNYLQWKLKKVEQGYDYKGLFVRFLYGLGFCLYRGIICQQSGESCSEFIYDFVREWVQFSSIKLYLVLNVGIQSFVGKN